MASFKFGSQTVDVDVSELASERTLNELLGAQKALNAALGAVKDEGNQSNNILAGIKRTIAQGNKDNDNSNKAQARSIRSGVSNAYNSIKKESTSATTFDSALSGFFKSINAGKIATAFGMANAAAISLGDSMRLLERFGLESFGNDIIDINNRLAGVGLSLNEFGQIIGTNTPVMRGLANSANEGSREFLSLVENFRMGARAAGGFTMTSAEMAEFLAEELEVRRASMDAEQFRNTTMEAFNGAILENLTQQKAMAKVTGQDVRERLKAQMTAKNSVIAQSFLNEQSDETRKKFDAVAGALSRIPGGDKLGEAIINGIATDLPANAFAPELIARLGSGAEELISFIEQGFAGGGDIDITQLEKMVEGVSDNMGQGGNILRTLAATGDTIAAEMLTINQKMVRTQDDLSKQYTSAYTELINGVTTSGSNLVTAMEEQATSIKAVQTELALNIADPEGIGTQALETFTQFTEGINTFLQGEFASNLAAGVGAGLSELGPQIVYELGQGNAPDVSETAFLGGVVARAVGQDAIANVMQLGQQGKALASGGAAFLRDFEPTQIGTRPDGAPIYSQEDQAILDLRDKFEEARTMNISVASITELAKSFASALSQVMD